MVTLQEQFEKNFPDKKEQFISAYKKYTKKNLKERLESKTYNKFFGSLEPIKNLTKLEKFCIAGTDVEEGIEYIPALIASKSGKTVRELTLENFEKEKGKQSYYIESKEKKLLQMEEETDKNVKNY
ncbi:hypothetical protein C1645_838288 [Glomus cerebriforme]|uniref:Uncharacterized protein n=1 Tax=Glomus cerebriforme TaxID=658196 RepID=A0A397S3W3_9GLOM|nr:hypothetical protein C1645_838288 [Glomus cerebriforme]